MHGGMESELPKCGRSGLPFAQPVPAEGSAGCLCGRACGDRVGTFAGSSDRVSGENNSVRARGRGAAKLRRCVRETSLAQAPRPGGALPGPSPQPPAAFFPRCGCACARDAGRRVLAAGRCPPAPGLRGDARTRRRKDTQAPRGVQVLRAGTRVSPPASLATCRAARPAPSAPAPTPGRPCAPGHHLPGRGHGRHRGLGSGGRCRCGRAPGGQRSAPRTERPRHRAAWPAARARPSAAGGRGLRPSAPHAPHRQRRATRRARLQPQL